MNKRQFSLALSQTKGIGPITYLSLINEFGSIEEVEEAYYQQKLPQKIISPLRESIKRNYEEKLNEVKTKYICIWEKEYPFLLKQISDPPPVLFYIGNLNLLHEARIISIVGTRKATSYGAQQAGRFSQYFADRKIPVVSGMAYGIDIITHRACLDSEGPTIAILPSPANIPSPAGHWNDYKRILESGVVASEIFPGTQLNKGMFASRNRIVAGLSEITLVIEAPERSGALITAQLAFDYNRLVYAIPNSITSKLVGCNNLLYRNIANIALSPELISRDLGWESFDTTIETSLNNGVYPDRYKELIKELSKSPLSLDQICKRFDRKASDALRLLAEIEVAGYILKTSDGSYNLKQ